MAEDGDERKMQEQKDFYLSFIRDLIAEQEAMLGRNVALQKARSAPLEIDKDGNINDFYGQGEDVLETLVQQFGGVWGEDVAQRKVRDTVRGSVPEEKYDLLPEYMIPSKEQKGILGQIVSQLKGSKSS